MKFIIQLVATLILSLVLELFLPWWSIALAAFVCGYLFKSKANFFAGFLAIVILWVSEALLIDMASATPLAEQVSKILMVNNTAILFLVMALLGGLVGGFASLTGSLLKKEKKSGYY